MDNKTAGIITLIVLILVGAYAIYGKKNTPGNQDTTSPTEEEVEVKVDAGKVLGTIESDSLGKYLTDYTGMTLYVFADDKKLESTCTGACLENWVPYLWDNNHDFAAFTNPLDKKVNAVKRDDDTRQYAYGEQPIYYYIGDKKPGDVNGNGLNNGKWSIVPVSQ